VMLHGGDQVLLAESEDKLLNVAQKLMSLKINVKMKIAANEGKCPAVILKQKKLLDNKIIYIYMYI
jgi:hypothetical protein